MTEHVTGGWRHRAAHVRALTRMVVSLAASVLVLLLLPSSLSIAVRAVASWDAFAIVLLASTWLTIFTLRPAQIRALAQREDPSRFASLIMVILGSAASLLAVIVLLQSTARLVGSDKLKAIVLALSAVALAWLLIHTVFTLRYAHLYYDESADATPLEFPDGTTSPDYLDFAYFAFIIGMTAQTADVSIRARRIRHAALLHGIVAFVFNTAVVALSIGVLSTLL